MKKLLKLTLIGLLGLGLTVSSCGDKDDPTPTDPDTTLYGKLGGTTMVSDPNTSGAMIEQGRLNLRAVVDSTIFVIAGTPDLAVYFAPLLQEVGQGNLSNIAVLSKDLVDFFCVASGAKNFTYTGLNMVAAHDPATNPRMGAKADNKAFDDFVAAVVTGAQQNDVPNDIIGEVGALIETLRDAVVQQ